LVPPTAVGVAARRGVRHRLLGGATALRDRPARKGPANNSRRKKRIRPSIKGRWIRQQSSPRGRLYCWNSRPPDHFFLLCCPGPLLGWASAWCGNSCGESVRGLISRVPEREPLQTEGWSSGTNISRQSVRIRASVLRTAAGVQIVLRPSVERTGAENASTRVHFGGSDPKRTGFRSCARTHLWLERHSLHIYDVSGLREGGHG
jgi:hypothetical protein